MFSNDNNVYPIIKNKDIAELFEYHKIPFLKIYDYVRFDKASKDFDEIRFKDKMVIFKSPESYYNCICYGIKCDINNYLFSIYVYNDKKLYDCDTNSYISLTTESNLKYNKITKLSIDFDKLWYINVNDYGNQIKIYIHNQTEPWIILNLNLY